MNTENRPQQHEWTRNRETMANLILSRKSGESIVIGENGDIVVTIQSVRGGTVDVRIAAPRDVPVHRDEIYAKLHPDAVPEAVAAGEAAAVAAASRVRKPRIYLRRRPGPDSGPESERGPDGDVDGNHD